MQNFNFILTLQEPKTIILFGGSCQKFEGLRDLCRGLPSRYYKQHSYPFFESFQHQQLIFFFFSTTLLRKMSYKITRLMFERCFLIPQLVFFSIICIHVFFSKFRFNFILKESLKVTILLKYFFHKIKFLFSGRVTKLLILI